MFVVLFAVVGTVVIVSDDCCEIEEYDEVPVDSVSITKEEPVVIVQTYFYDILFSSQQIVGIHVRSSTLCWSYLSLRSNITLCIYSNRCTINLL